MDRTRALALRLLCDITEEGRLLPEMAGRRLAPLKPAEKARAQRLVLQTLRWRDRSDRMLGPYLRMKPRAEAMNALRMALAEIFVDGAAPHGVVDETVGIVRAGQEAGAQAGLVNAVLRRAVKQPQSGWDKLPVPRLPKWLRKPLLADYGKAAVAEMEACFANVPPLDLTVRDDAAGWADRLDGEVLPTGSVRLRKPGQVSALPGFAEGAWWVQDAAAALPVRALAPQAGEKVLDLCAAPGGKTLQLAAAGAAVTALDISETRMARVQENLARCGLSAEVVVGDALSAELPGDGQFDAILLDAPCSATGTIRRHPDLPMAKTGEEFPELFRLQERMIDRALTRLAPGGRLVFCTCSLLIDEGEEQVRDALGRHEGLRVDTEALSLPGIAPEWIGPEGLRLRPDYWPELGGMDGFFITVLRR
ncbi:RsmB/NOP family class I SAM-dependent RNA methyltransferase [Palleronia caenipelagi]|uniref:Methyltransferase domain-containing protein n=1 Tax=Palleronia caenipelagi TaxID=2489174 RepID=A0A547Q7A6_9RHOB|nr:transcription antitermination factor NusB [Palleronia caenipelagi]TRD22249.1 methyltransferase domain-containing protein [Palleronia caenipelagi]